MAATNIGLDEDVLQWVKKDNRRFLRANIRVVILIESSMLSRQDFQEQKYSTAVVAFGNEENHFVLGLTHHHEHYLTDEPADKLDIGTAFNHFGLAIQDVYGTVERIRAAGGTIAREPGPIAEGGMTIFAFVNDPDGYSFELILRPSTPESLCQICLNVTDLDSSIEFYQKLAIGSDDVYKSAAAVELVNQELGGKIIRPPALNPKTNTKITCLLDSDGFETVLVDNHNYADFNSKIQG